MKINLNTPINFVAGDVLTPEDFNTNVAYVADCNTDLMTKRYTRWTNTYQFKNITNTSSTSALRQYLPRPEYVPSTLFFYGVKELSVPNGAVGAVTLLDCGISDDGFDLFILFNDAGRTAGNTRVLQRYKLSIRFDIQTAVYSSEVTLATATYGTVNTFDLQGFTQLNTGGVIGSTREITFGTAAGIINAYSMTVLSSSFNLGSLLSTLNVSAEYASLGFVRYLKDTSSITPYDYLYELDPGAGSGYGAKIYYGSGTATTYRERTLGTRWRPSTAGASTLYTTTYTVNGISITIPKSNTLESYNIGSGGGIYFTGTDFISSYRPAISNTSEYNRIDNSTYLTLQNMHVPLQGFGAYTCVNNNKIAYFPFQTPYLAPPQVAIERIIVTAYFTGGFKISFNNFNSTTILNPDTMLLIGEGNIAETDSSIKHGEFSAKKVVLNNYNSANPPYFEISTYSSTITTFNILKLDVEIHYISDRLYSTALSYAEPNIDASRFFVNENDTAAATLVNDSIVELKRNININYNLYGGLRWAIYDFKSVASGVSSTIYAYKTYPSGSTNEVGKLYGAIAVIKNSAGGNVQAGTYTVNFGFKTLSKTLAVAGGTSEYIHCGNTTSTLSITDMTDSNINVGNISINTSNSNATPHDILVYLLYA